MKTAEIHTNRGVMKVEFYEQDAPNTVKNFTDLAKQGFYDGLISYITSSPIVAAVFEGPNAIAAARATMGKTNPSLAEAGTIRGDLGLETGRNLVHGSDGPESAAREIALFFEADELASYGRGIDDWVRE